MVDSFSQTPKLLNIEGSNENKLNLEVSNVQRLQRTPENASIEANKIQSMLGDNSPGLDVLERDILAGDETFWKQEAARRHSTVEERNRINLLRELVTHGPVDNRQLAIVESLTQKDFEKMEGANFYETEYGKKFVEDHIAEVATIQPDVDDGQTAKRNNVATDWTAKYQGLYALMDELTHEQQDAGWFTRATDTLEGFVPLLSQIRTSGRIGETDSLFAGENLKEQVENFHFMPTEEALAKLRMEVEKLKGSNYNDAIKLVGAMISYGQDQSGLDNLFTILDAADVATLGAASVLRMGSRTAKALSRKTLTPSATVDDAVEATPVPETPTELPRLEVKDTLRSRPQGDLKSRPDSELVSRPRYTIRSRPDRTRITPENSASVYKGVMRAATRRDPKPEFVYDDLGLPDLGAISAVERELQGLRGGRDIMAATPSLFRIGDLLADSSTLTSATIARLKATTQRLIAEGVGKRTSIQRTSSRQLEEAVQRAKAEIADHFSNVNASVLNAARYAVRNETDDIAGVNSVSIQFGKGDGELFTTADEAQAFVNEFIRPKTDDYKIVNKGYGHYVEFTKNVDESLSFDSMSIPIENLSQDNALNNFIGMLRTPKDVVSPEVAKARNVAVHGTQQFNQILSESLEPLFRLQGPLSKKELEDMSKVLGVYRDKMDPATGKTGYWDRTVPDFIDTFKQRTGKQPTEKQIEAYYSFVRAYDLDYTLRNLNWYKDRARLGVEEITPKGLVDEQGNPFMVEGRVEPNINWNETDNRANIMIVDGSKVRNVGFPSQERRVEINKLVEEGGYKVIRVADPSIDIPGGRPFTKYILSNNFKRNRLSAKRTPYRGGGHKLNRYPYMVKSPKFSVDESGRRYYRGDNVLFTAPTGKQAEKIAGILEDARRVHAEGGDVDEFLRVKFPHAQGKKMAQFIKSSPKSMFVRADSGLRTVDVHRFGDYVDTKQATDNLYSEIDSRFSQERSEENVDVLREEEGVINPYNADGLVDPFTSLSEGLSSVIQGRHLSDLKVKSAHDFVLEFEDILDYPQEQLRNRPIEVLLDTANKFKESADTGRVQRAKATKRAAQHILRQQTAEVRALDNVKERMVENLFEKGAVQGKFLDRLQATTTDNAINFVKTVAFEASMGLFNIFQFPLQAQTVFTVFSIAPTHATKALIMAMAENMQRINKNPKLTDSMDELLTSRVGQAIGLNKGDYKLFKEVFEDSGFSTVAGDYAMLDDFVNPKLNSQSSMFGKVLHAGRTPFTEGERLVRSVANFTAASEWRKKNPFGKLNAAAKRDILDRADDLSINMGAQNNAIYQRGILSIPTQFMGFFIRYGELMLGKRLTKAEKLRIVAANSALYGLPTGMGTALGLTAVLPIADMTDKKLLAEKEALRKAGIDIDDSGWMEAFKDGVPAIMFEWITGVDLDTGRYEPGGNPFLWDIFKGETGFMEALLGASGSSLGRAWGARTPIFRAIADPDIDLSINDFLGVARSASSVDHAVKSYMYLKYQEWQTRTGKVFNVEDNEALAMMLTGTPISEITETYQAGEIMSNDNKWAAQIRTEAEKVGRRLLLRNLTDAEFSQEFERVNTYLELLGYRPDQKYDFYQTIMGNEDDFTLINERMQKYYERKDRRR